MSTRALRQSICQMLIATVVFVHTSVAAYGCARIPGTPTAVQMQATMLSEGTETEHRGKSTEGGQMARGDGDMTQMSVGLCASHCLFGNQSADRAPSPVAAPVLLSVLYALEPADQGQEAQAARPASPTQGAPPPPDPPHTLLHCCLRD
jgi:hypothetical protein